MKQSTKSAQIVEDAATHLHVAFELLQVVRNHPKRFHVAWRFRSRLGINVSFSVSLCLKHGLGEKRKILLCTLDALKSCSRLAFHKSLLPLAQRRHLMSFWGFLSQSREAAGFRNVESPHPRLWRLPRRDFLVNVVHRRQEAIPYARQLAVPRPGTVCRFCAALEYAREQASRRGGSQ